MRDPRLHPAPCDVLTKGVRRARYVCHFEGQLVVYKRSEWGYSYTTTTLHKWREWAKEAEVVRQNDKWHSYSLQVAHVWLMPPDSRDLERQMNKDLGWADPDKAEEHYNQLHPTSIGYALAEYEEKTRHNSEVVHQHSMNAQYPEEQGCTPEEALYHTLWIAMWKMATPGEETNAGNSVGDRLLRWVAANHPDILDKLGSAGEE